MSAQCSLPASEAELTGRPIYTAIARNVSLRQFYHCLLSLFFHKLMIFVENLKILFRNKNSGQLY